MKMKIMSENMRMISKLAYVFLVSVSLCWAQVPFEQRADKGLLVFEAEHYHAVVDVGVQAWKLRTAPAGCSGGECMEDTGSGNSAGAAFTGNARMDYVCKFVVTGRHYTWVRFRATGGADSCHMGIDGAVNTTGDDIWTPVVKTEWAWSNKDGDGANAQLDRTWIDIPTTGLHTVNIYHRETGVFVDKILLTTDEAYVPEGEGPAETREGPGVAKGPYPSSPSADIPRYAILSWSPGEFAAKHDVYLGTVFADVNDASRANPKGVLMSQGQDANTYDPVLQFGQTYYWRVDEVNAPPTNTVFKGSVWSFTAEPVAYPIKGITATASSSQSTDMVPGKTIDGSGVNASDQHGTNDKTMWLSNIAGPQPTWIQYAFDKVYKLHQMWVWNSNQSLEAVLGLGAKDVTVEYSTDSVTWTALAGVSQFARATGTENYIHNTTVDFGGVAARYVRINIASNWGGILPQFGLSEVRFFYIPVWAREPKPASGAANVDPAVVLGWRPGREATTHQLYVGLDANSLPVAGSVGANSFDTTALALQLGQTYFWKVNEVNDAATPASWEGQVWSFSTPEYLVVDDFESYDDLCKRIFFSWVDGFGHSGSVDCGVAASGGNGTGSAVGNMQAPFAGMTIIHGGKQSMPLAYDSTGGKASSEAERAFGVPQDWTRAGVKTLVLYFYGDPGNASGQVYVKVNGTKVVYSGNANALKTPYWAQWNIELASLGANLKGITKLAIGVEGTSGKGIMYVDDIRLYRLAPPAPKEMIWIEAESGSPTAPLMTVDDPTASGGKYISTENLGITGAHLDGIAKYPFTVQGGTYRIYGRVIEPAGGGSNSFWVRLPGATMNTTPSAANDGWINWNFAVGTTWHWGDVINTDAANISVRYTLAPGTYTLEIAYREDGARLDAIVISD